MATKKKASKSTTRTTAKASKSASPKRAAAEPTAPLPQGYDLDLDDALAEPLEDTTGIFQVTKGFTEKWGNERTGTHHLRPFVRSDTKLTKPKR
jgi:hypothetical protein